MGLVYADLTGLPLIPAPPAPAAVSQQTGLLAPLYREVELREQREAQHQKQLAELQAQHAAKLVEMQAQHDAVSQKLKGNCEELATEVQQLTKRNEDAHLLADHMNRDMRSLNEQRSKAVQQRDTALIDLGNLRVTSQAQLHTLSVAQASSAKAHQTALGELNRANRLKEQLENAIDRATRAEAELKEAQEQQAKQAHTVAVQSGKEHKQSDKEHKHSNLAHQHSDQAHQHSDPVDTVVLSPALLALRRRRRSAAPERKQVVDPNATEDDEAQVDSAPSPSASSVSSASALALASEVLVPPLPKKRGRPPKAKNLAPPLAPPSAPLAPAAAPVATGSRAATVAGVAVALPKKRGRPPKVAKEQITKVRRLAESNPATGRGADASTAIKDASIVIKRKRGRPRKHPLPVAQDVPEQPQTTEVIDLTDITDD